MGITDAEIAQMIAAAVYRVDNRLGGYKLVRSIGRFCASGGGIVGVTYEIVEKLRVVGFEAHTARR